MSGGGGDGVACMRAPLSAFNDRVRARRVIHTHTHTGGRSVANLGRTDGPPTTHSRRKPLYKQAESRPGSVCDVHPSVRTRQPRTVRDRPAGTRRRAHTTRRNRRVLLYLCRTLIRSTPRAPSRPRTFPRVPIDRRIAHSSGRRRRKGFAAGGLQLPGCVTTASERNRTRRRAVAGGHGGATCTLRAATAGKIRHAR